ncbi:GIY-YIG nuclease family protein [Clavibacter zhangzhiyongii]|uniref:GIY-YIG nuclease family protein n=1 Tax=Clavibacter zhangzhiyongii TaxID=2768071 RepID=A0A7L7YZM9_9MICO|nr:GIY-YIG nuclease family protein [Clavibacter zhangzhiyongii]QOD42930.1 GIY-YIG nuclease family protein [Clavibacter zhangzhiyongii]
MTETLRPLSFTRYDMSSAGSAAALFADSKTVCGIYVLEFEDGMKYVGQTRQIVSRYASHRRTHRDIVAFSFAPCTAAALDEHERQEIRRQEAADVSLRNLNLTGWPAGSGDMDVTIANGESILLPWDRARRLRLDDEGAATTQRRFWALAARDDYEEMADAVAKYLDECVADPFGTQRYLWNIVAFPKTGQTKSRRRLFTLNCGGLETLFALEHRDGDETQIQIHVNFDEDRTLECMDEAGMGTQMPDDFYDIRDTPYTSAAVIQSTFYSWSDFARALDFAPFVEGAYKLNTMQMRRKSSPFHRHHNQGLADDMLRRAATRLTLSRA